MAIIKNLLLSRNWRDYTATKVVMKNIYMSPSRIQYLLEWAYISFYLSPRRILKDIFMRKAVLTKRVLKSILKMIIGAL